MKICIIYYSKSGNTKLIAEKIKTSLENEQCQVDLIEIEPVKHPGFLKAGYSAVKQKAMPIKNTTTDLSQYDRLIFGSPLWAGNPAPYIKSFIAVATGLEGKTCNFYLTCAGDPERQPGGFDVLRENLQICGLTTADNNPGIQINKKGVIKNDSALKSFLESLK